MNSLLTFKSVLFFCSFYTVCSHGLNKKISQVCCLANRKRNKINTDFFTLFVVCLCKEK